MTPKRTIVPEPFKITVEGGQFDIVGEEVKGRPNYVVLRRWDAVAGNVRRKAVGTIVLRDAKGKVLPEATQLVRDAAMKWYMEITGQLPTDTPTVAPKEKATFTIGETWAAISDEQTGKYPHKSAFRSELAKALEFTVTKWGSRTTWASIDDDRWTAMIRDRVTELVNRKKKGVRATEIMMSRLITAARWLRKTKRIPADAGIPPDEWKKDLRVFWRGLTGAQSDPAPDRPRFTLEETRKILKAADQVDPRMALALALGAELRLGQVVRAMRSHLVLGNRVDVVDEKEVETPIGTYTVFGMGHKSGQEVYLTPGQIASAQRALAGYLAPLEAKYVADGTDYPLFPGGRMLFAVQRKPGVKNPRLGKGNTVDVHVSPRWVVKVFRRVVEAAGLPRVEGLGPYGLRRQLVDASLAENISEQGLKAHGGWKSGAVPRDIYADAQNKIGREEARDIRAKIRGETSA